MVIRLNLHFTEAKVKLGKYVYKRYLLTTTFNKEFIENFCQDKDIHSCSANVIITKKDPIKILNNIKFVKQILENDENIDQKELKKLVIRLLKEIEEMLEE
jgi:hypothetical protein